MNDRILKPGLSPTNGRVPRVLSDLKAEAIRQGYNLRKLSLLLRERGIDLSENGLSQALTGRRLLSTESEVRLCEILGKDANYLGFTDGKEAQA